MNLFYNPTEIFVSLVFTFNLNCNRKTERRHEPNSSPNYHFKSRQS